MLLVILSATLGLEPTIIHTTRRTRMIERSAVDLAAETSLSHWYLSRGFPSPYWRYDVVKQPNSTLFWPALALMCFVIAKYAWAVGIEAEGVLAEDPEFATRDGRRPRG
ncbi:MAG: hypothetical protein K2Y37_05930 [Pirellulales bacterium]|nr:hypothetical protein [Pirellulales bacterium]